MECVQSLFAFLRHCHKVINRKQPRAYAWGGEGRGAGEGLMTSILLVIQGPVKPKTESNLMQSIFESSRLNPLVSSSFSLVSTLHMDTDLTKRALRDPCLKANGSVGKLSCWGGGGGGEGGRLYVEEACAR